VLPVAGEPPADVAAIGEYGDDRIFVQIANQTAPDGANAALADALEAAGQPVFRLAASGPEDLGRLMFVFEFAVAVIGHVLEINPFDQPNVQEAKDATNRVLEAGELELAFDAPGALAQLVAGQAPPTYFAIMAYTATDPALDAAIDDLRRAIRAKTHAATTFGYGPRFLHSTGQLHKGGPPEGSFIQLVHDAGPDVAIPERDFSFRQLKTAQAIGDVQTLKAHGRPVVRLRLEGDAAAAVRELTRLIA